MTYSCKGQFSRFKPSCAKQTEEAQLAKIEAVITSKFVSGFTKVSKVTSASLAPFKEEVLYN